MVAERAKLFLALLLLVVDTRECIFDIVVLPGMRAGSIEDY